MGFFVCFLSWMVKIVNLLFADDIYYAQRLMSATVNLVSQEKCKKYYDNIRVTDNMVCAGDPVWVTDACKVKLVCFIF